GYMRARVDRAVARTNRRGRIRRCRELGSRRWTRARVPAARRDPTGRGDAGGPRLPNGVRGEPETHLRLSRRRDRSARGRTRPGRDPRRPQGTHRAHPGSELRTRPRRGVRSLRMSRTLLRRGAGIDDGPADRCRPSALRADGDDHLAEVPAGEQVVEVLGSPLQTGADVLAVADLALLEPAAHIGEELIGEPAGEFG